MKNTSTKKPHLSYEAESMWAFLSEAEKKKALEDWGGQWAVECLEDDIKDIFKNKDDIKYEFEEGEEHCDHGIYRVAFHPEKDLAYAYDGDTDEYGFGSEKEVLEQVAEEYERRIECMEYYESKKELEEELEELKIGENEDRNKEIEKDLKEFERLEYELSEAKRMLKAY